MISMNTQIYTFIHISTNRSNKDHKHSMVIIRLGVLELLVDREFATVVVFFEGSLVVIVETDVVNSGTLVEH